MGEFIEKYGGVLITVAVIAVLVAVCGTLFSADDGIGKEIADSVSGLSDKVQDALGGTTPSGN